MKTIIGIFIILLSVNLFAETLADSLDFPFKREQELETPDDGAPQTLLGSDFTFSGFGGPIITYGKLNDEDMIMVGGRGAMIMSDFLLIGGGGMGMVNPTKRYDFTGETYRGDYKYVHFGYGGGLIGVNFFQKSIINVSLSTLIGAGGYHFISDWDDDDDDENNSRRDTRNDEDDSVDPNGSDVFFVAEPMLLAHINVTRWFRFGTGVAYRYTKGIDTGGVNDDDFRDWSLVFVADFGWF